MLNETWKQKIVRYTQTGPRSPLLPKTQRGASRTVLGQKLLLKKTMRPPLEWLRKFRGDVLYDEPLAKHTSIRIGGPADIFLFPKDMADLQVVLRNRGDLPLLVVGEGSNLLVRDGGWRGIVVCLKDGFKAVGAPEFFQRPDGKEAARLKAGAGVKMSYLAKYAARYGLTGIEELVGIPGSLGGALFMNAGAEGVEISECIHSITRLTDAGEIQVIGRDDVAFSYRRAQFPLGGGIIVEAELELEKAESRAVFTAIDEYLERRSRKQPLSSPNSGSIFKNPPNDTAGRLIESVGLKGFSVGNAAISLKHANFIINQGNATAENVVQLIDHVRDAVKEKTGVTLETEIIVVGIE
jgi:UDP-N-acetylmuramate dehydrogenase